MTAKKAGMTAKKAGQFRAVVIPCRGGSFPVAAIATGPMLVYWGFDENRDPGWVVAHATTGHAVKCGIDRLADAEQVAKELAQNPLWAFLSMAEFKAIDPQLRQSAIEALANAGVIR